MTYQEALDHSLNVRWKTFTCEEGEKCWCRGITTEEPLSSDDDEEVYVMGSGMVHKEHAEYIVYIHNKYIRRNEHMKKGEAFFEQASLVGTFKRPDNE